MKLKKSPIPLYYQLDRALRKRINSGQITPEDPFPTERQLCEEFGVSRTTVRQTLMILENEGLIKRKQGRGTFVVGREEANSPMEMYGYIDDLFIVGARSKLEFHSKELVKIDALLSQDMGLEEGEEVYFFEGIRVFDFRLRALFQAHLPKEIGEQLPWQNLDSPYLISVVEKISLETVKHAKQITSAILATEHQADLMKIPSGSPLLVTKRIYFSSKDAVLQMATTYLPGGVYNPVSKLERIIS